MCAWLLFLGLVYLLALFRASLTMGWFGSRIEPLLVTQFLAILGVLCCAALIMWVLVKPQRWLQLIAMWFLTAGSMAISLSNL